MEISETDLKIYRCHICKQVYMEIGGELLKYVERRAEEENKPLDKFMDDLFEVLEKMERKTDD